MAKTAQGKKLTVLIAEDDVDSHVTYRTPQRDTVPSMSTMMASPYMGGSTPYSHGSVAGSTTKHARRRNPREHHDEERIQSPRRLDRMESRNLDPIDLEPSLLIDRNGSIGTERMGSKYEKIQRQPLGGGGGGGDDGENSHTIQNSKKKKRSKIWILLAAVAAALVGSFLVSSETITLDSLLTRNLENNVNGQYYDPSFHQDEFEDLMAAVSTPTTAFNTRRSCVSSDNHAAGGDGVDKVPDLIEIHAWKSRKPVAGRSISLVTHLSVDRLPSLEQQCLIWPDKIVASIYVPMTTNSSGSMPLLPGYSSTTLDDMIRGIGSFHVYMEKTAVCSMDLIFLGQFVNKPDAPGPYPTNALRNKALSLVSTELSLHANVDVLLNPYLDSPDTDDRRGVGYKDPELYSELLIAAKKKTAFLLPILEVASGGQDARIVRNIARSQALAGKRSAADFMAKGVLVPYVAPEDAERRRWSINLDRWVASSPKDGHLLVKIGKGQPPVSSVSEPCVLLATEKTPWFDERFVDNGPGINIWTKALEHEKFKFRVHSSGFGVHMSHERRAPKSQYLQRRKDFRMEVMQFLNSTLEQDIQKGKFKPMVQDCGKFVKVGVGGMEDTLDVGME